MSKQSYPGASEGLKGETGEKEPKGSAKADLSGERKEGKVNGVGLGKEDATGRSNGSKETGEYNTGRSEKVCYTHSKVAHDQDK